ncbi:MAG: hypothetical protein V9E87_06010 [Gemmatimonadales bacterium]
MRFNRSRASTLLYALELLGGAATIGAPALCAQAGPSPSQFELVRQLEADKFDLSRLSGFVTSPTGLLAVPQGQDFAIRIFTADLKPVATVGRRGAGPGEFQAMGAMAWRGDQLVVSDKQLARAAVFSSAGKYVRGYRLPAVPADPASKYKQLTLQRFLADGSLLFSTVYRAQPSGWTRKALVLSETGGFVREVADIPDDHCELERADASLIIPYCPRTLVAYAPRGGLVVTGRPLRERAGQAGLELRMVSSQGAQLTAATVRVPTVPLSGARKDSTMTELYRNVPYAKEMLRGVDVPSVLPPVREMQVGDDGTIWLKLSRIEQGKVLWWILDRTGRPMASVWLAVEDRLVWVEGRQFALIQSDDGGSERIAWYRLK